MPMNGAQRVMVVIWNGKVEGLALSHSEANMVRLSGATARSCMALPIAPKLLVMSPIGGNLPGVSTVDHRITPGSACAAEGLTRLVGITKLATSRAITSSPKKLVYLAFNYTS